MKMFTKEELEKIKEQYYKIYKPLFETDYFSVLYDKSEDEWCYVINEEITKKQLADAALRFSVEIANLDDYSDDKIKSFTILDFIDYNDKMMRDKNIYKLFVKFNTLYPSFYNLIK